MTESSRLQYPEVLPAPFLRSRFGNVVAVVAVIILGLASRKFPALFPAFLGKYPGDALWALMMFLLVGIAFPRRSTAWVAVVALAISFAVEFSQLFQAPWIDAIRRTTLGALVLGSGFSWVDMIAYTVGVTVGAVGERIAARKGPSFRSY